MTDQPLDGAQITQGLTGSSWAREGEAIVREVELADFAAVIAAVNRVAAAAEQANHHPDLLIHDWNKLRLTLSTHSAGGITRADLEMAARLDDLI